MGLERIVAYIDEHYVDVEEGTVYQKIGKRTLDLLLVLPALILLIPVFIGIAIAVKCTSKGPILFGQERVGLNGKTFTMYKFRSMVVDAEEQKAELANLNEADGPMFKIKDDPRITKTGKFIRKTSLDELPQLWNVLKGEMSLVGPRPSLPNEVVQFEEWMYHRLVVLPGLTCIWQTTPGKNDLSHEEWIHLDLQYIQKQSFKADILLIIKTFTVIFSA